MQEHAIELALGESVQIGHQILTLVDVHGGEAVFRIDSPSEQDCQFPRFDRLEIARK